METDRRFSAGGQAQAGVPTPRNGVSWTEGEVAEMEQVSASTHSLFAGRVAVSRDL